MLHQSLQQIQTLRQELAPQQLQSLEILMLPTLELERKISDELQENPTLELVDTGTQKLAGNPVENDSEALANDSDAAARAAEADENIATLIQLDQSWHDYVPPRGAGGSFSSEDEERRQFMLNSLVDEPSLQEELLAQMRQNDAIGEGDYPLYEEVIGSIDQRGYLAVAVEEIAAACDHAPAEVEKALQVVQGFDPPGIGARDLRECLLLQLDRQGRKGSLAYKVVSKHLDELGRNQIPQVTRKLRVSATVLYEAVEEIKGLHPFPGTLLAPGNTDYVVPEIAIAPGEDGQWAIETNRDTVPRLRLSRKYLGMLKDPSVDAETKAYIRKKLTGSKGLIRALSQRQSTLELIAESLLKFQRDFFDNGIHGMKPLILSQVADEIGVHETTVSRAIAGKYVQTPHGLFPFRHFFSGGLSTAAGGMVSTRSVKERIQELLQAENPSHPLSDQKLADLLKEKGFKVARRTVAKYREELGILPSNQRRRY